jgi:hypothetical protein
MFVIIVSVNSRPAADTFLKRLCFFVYVTGQHTPKESNPSTGSITTQQSVDVAGSQGTLPPAAQLAAKTATSKQTADKPGLNQLNLESLTLEQLEKLREKAREKQWEDEWLKLYLKMEQDKRDKATAEREDKENKIITQHNITLTRQAAPCAESHMQSCHFWMADSKQHASLL